MKTVLEGALGRRTGLCTRRTWLELGLIRLGAIMGSLAEAIGGMGTGLAVVWASTSFNVAAETSRSTLEKSGGLDFSRIVLSLGLTGMHSVLSLVGMVIAKLGIEILPVVGSDFVGSVIGVNVWVLDFVGREAVMLDFSGVDFAQFDFWDWKAGMLDFTGLKDSEWGILRLVAEFSFGELGIIGLDGVILGFSGLKWSLLGLMGIGEFSFAALKACLYGNDRREVGMLCFTGLGVAPFNFVGLKTGVLGFTRLKVGVLIAVGLEGGLMDFARLEFGVMVFVGIMVWLLACIGLKVCWSDFAGLKVGVSGFTADTSSSLGFAELYICLVDFS